MMKNKIDDSIRPTCSCGHKMEFVRYKGYYEEFEYWECNNPECNIEDNIEPEDEWRGSYA